MAGGRAGLDPRRGQPWLMLHPAADCHREPSTAERRRLVAIGLLRALAATVDEWADLQGLGHTIRRVAAELVPLS
jgi:hypothetical protein